MLNKKETARILAHSKNTLTNTEFITFLISLPKYLLAELNTHRMLVRNCASSRAIPVFKMIDNVMSNPVEEVFTKNQSGMQGIDNAFSEEELIEIQAIWDCHLYDSVDSVERLKELGVHKQHTNRLLEAHMNVEVLVSGTEWDNFYNLRCHPDAQPGFKKVAEAMRSLHEKSVPTELKEGDWHVPFSDLMDKTLPLETKLKIAIARAARLSYSTHDGEYSVEKDLELFERLVSSKHFSCLEHCAVAVAPLSNSFPGYRAMPVSLKPFLFEYDEYQDGNMTMGFSRQYAGFYTYRSQVEDNCMGYIHG